VRSRVTRKKEERRARLLGMQRFQGKEKSGQHRVFKREKGSTAKKKRLKKKNLRQVMEEVTPALRLVS